MQKAVLEGDLPMGRSRKRPAAHHKSQHLRSEKRARKAAGSEAPTIGRRAPWYYGFMTRQSKTLAVIASAILLFDGILIYDNYFRPNAALTHIGLDSLVMVVPASLHAPQYRNGQWDADPSKALNLKYFDPPPGEGPKEMAMVSLGPNAHFGQAVEIIRQLKTKNICHFIIREAATVTPVPIDFGNGPEKSLDVPSIVLCGHSYGDAGFDGKLATDRLLHVGAGPK